MCVLRIIVDYLIVITYLQHMYSGLKSLKDSSWLFLNLSACFPLLFFWKFHWLFLGGREINSQFVKYV